MLLEHMSSVANFYSVGTLLKTMFSPWRQIVSTTRADQGVDAKFQAFLDNIISRFVGFFVRLFVLIAAVVFVTLTILANLVLLIIWPVAPVLPLILVIVGVT